MRNKKIVLAATMVAAFAATGLGASSAHAELVKTVYGTEIEEPGFGGELVPVSEAIAQKAAWEKAHGVISEDNPAATTTTQTQTTKPTTQANNQTPVKQTNNNTSVAKTNTNTAQKTANTSKATTTSTQATTVQAPKTAVTPKATTTTNNNAETTNNNAEAGHQFVTSSVAQTKTTQAPIAKTSVKSTTTNKPAATLPQTGETNETGIAFLGAMAALFGLGATGLKRKRRI